MSRRLYLLDFDRCLFDTARFQIEVAEILSPNDPDKFTQDIPKFTDAGTGYYSVYEQAESYTGLTKPEITDMLNQNLKHTDYCFPDVPPWIKSHQSPDCSLQVLTVGGPDYQNLKFGRAPSLTNVPKHLIKDSKSELLDRELKDQQPPYTLPFVEGEYDEVWIVDDHPNHLTNLTHLDKVNPVRIIRPEGKYSSLPTPSDVKDIIVSFGELE